MFISFETSWNMPEISRQGWEEGEKKTIKNDKKIQMEQINMEKKKKPAAISSRQTEYQPQIK